MARWSSYQVESQAHGGPFTPLPTIIFLLHISAGQLQLKPCYQFIPLNGWSAVYIDSFCDELVITEKNHGTDEEGDGYEVHPDQTAEWMSVAFCLTSAPSISDVRQEFGPIADAALYTAIQSLTFQQAISPQDLRARRCTLQDFYRKQGVNVSLPVYNGTSKEWVYKLITKRYIVETLTDSFAALWGRLLEFTVQDNCDKLARYFSIF